MSAISINKKIVSANSKVAKILGSKYDVYRPINFLDPISEQNWSSNQLASFALDVKHQKAQTFGFDVYMLYTDSTIIETGDIFLNDFGTYVVINKETLQEVLAYKSNRTITVTRPAYTTTGTFTWTETSITLAIPALVQYSNVSDSKLSAPSTNSSTLPAWNINVWLPDDSLKVADIVVDSLGNRSEIVSLQWSQLGYTLKTKELIKA